MRYLATVESGVDSEHRVSNVVYSDPRKVASEWKWVAGAGILFVLAAIVLFVVKRDVWFFWAAPLAIGLLLLAVVAKLFLAKAPAETKYIPVLDCSNDRLVYLPSGNSISKMNIVSAEAVNVTVNGMETASGILVIVKNEEITEIVIPHKILDKPPSDILALLVQRN